MSALSDLLSSDSIPTVFGIVAVIFAILAFRGDRQSHVAETATKAVEGLLDPLNAKVEEQAKTIQVLNDRLSVQGAKLRRMAACLKKHNIDPEVCE